MRPVDITGQRFGQLVAVESTRCHRTRKLRWRCLCDCGAFTTVTLCNLKSGNTTSCGCQQYLNRKSGRITVEERPEYKCWQAMLSRCCRSSTPGYMRYGGRGITVCERWRTFAHFLADMGPRPSPAHTIDRINNDGNYEPSNCRWATSEEQNRNRADNLYIEAFGKRMILADWARELGLNPQTIGMRLKKGWPAEVALTALKKHGPRRDLGMHMPLAT